MVPPYEYNSQHAACLATLLVNMYPELLCLSSVLWDWREVWKWFSDRPWSSFCLVLCTSTQQLAAVELCEVLTMYTRSYPSSDGFHDNSGRAHREILPRRVELLDLYSGRQRHLA
ncbi:hypothetical protein M422DRAFT_266470 [Sphaerobolus stellatus SS14]|nr:hypothetical protein M422DRAFT_266470 [Sphaerobolus stellatus SS14]